MVSTFRSVKETAAFVRGILKNVDGKFSVKTTPTTGIDRSLHSLNTIYVRWTGGASFSEIKHYLNSFGIHLNANRGPVVFVLTRQ